MNIDKEMIERELELDKELASRTDWVKVEGCDYRFYKHPTIKRLYASKESLIARYSTVQDKMILIRSHKAANGYMRIIYRNNVCDGGNGESINLLVHKIILETFIDKPNDTETWCVDHYDDDRKNCRLSNLHWLTIQDNLKKRDKNGKLLKKTFTYDRMNNYAETIYKSRIDAADGLGVQRSNLTNAIKHELILSNRYLISDTELYPEEVVCIFKAWDIKKENRYNRNFNKDTK